MQKKLSRTGQKLFSFVPYATDMFCHNTNEQLIEEIFYREKILGIFQGTYDHNQKSFTSEFLDFE